MKTPHTGIYLDLFLSRHPNAAPLSEQLYGQIKDLVVKGFLAPGDLLPPSRLLAQELGIGRNTVVAAYRQLTEEGFLHSEVGHGTRVSETLPLTVVPKSAETEFFSCRPPKMSLNPVASKAKEAYGQGVDPELPFSLMSPDLQTLPGKRWVQLVTRCQKIPWRHNGYTAAEGIPDYRQAVAKSLKDHRGVVCDYRQVVAVSNIRQGLALCAQLLLKPGDTVAVEDPGYGVHNDLLRFYGLNLIPIPVGEMGIDLEKLFSLKTPPKAVLATPHNQFPTTVSMDQESKKALIEWANLNNVWIIEDDYDGHISFEKYPSAALSSFDAHFSNTVLLGSFSRATCPGFKLGYVIVHRSLVPVFAGARLFSDRQCCENHEVVMVQFIQNGDFDAHLRKLRKILFSRRNALLSALKAELSALGSWREPNNGCHVCFEFYKPIDDVGFTEYLRQKYRLVTRPLSSQFLCNKRKSGLILGYSGFSEDTLNRSVKLLKKGVLECLSEKSKKGAD